MTRVENNGLCTACGGLCCLRAPGRYAPDELESTGGANVAGIQAKLDAGFSSVTVSFVAVCDGRVAPVFTLAARGVGKGELVLCASNLRCTLLGLSKCTLPLEQRPYECAAMVPHQQVSQCRIPDDQLIEEFWLPYQQELWQVIELRSGLTWQEELRRQVSSAPDYDQYAQGVRELLATLGLASGIDEIRDVATRAWSQ